MTIHRAFIFLLMGAALPALCPAAPLDPKNPPQGRFIDDWAVIHMAGGKVGYVHSSMTRRGDVVETNTVTKMRIGRADQPIEITTTQATTETLTGTPTAFSFEMNASVMTTAMRGTIKDGRITIVSAQYGMEQTRVFDFAPDSLMTWGLFRESLLKGFAPGTEYASQAYVPELRLDGPISAVTRVGDLESFEVDGKTQRGRRVDLVIEAPAGKMELISWVDKDGTPLRVIVPAAGLGDMELIMTDQATALADFIPPEFFRTTMVKAGREIDGSAAHRIRYRIRTRGSKIDFTQMPAAGMQAVVETKDGSVELVVTRQSHTPPEPRASARADDQPPLGSEALAEFLGSNLMINTGDPQLVALAERAAGGETEPYALADRLRRFVTDYVKTKSLNIGFATASEVCRLREGDCSEHGVLLAALGRIRGLPSRVVVGLAYVHSFGGQTDVFGYHLWTQFYIDGRWIDVDAALPETVCSPTRIAFAASSLMNNGMADLSLPLLSKIGAIEVDILEINETPPKPE